MPSNLNYTDNGNGTVTDNITSLVWQQSPPNQNYTQTQAISYCASLNLGGDTDWRLPSLIELLSIVDPTKGDGSTTPPINATVFPGTKLSPYWTTTSSVATAGSAWYITFLDGSNGMNATGTLNYLRCVR
jgi:hypothetical protein